jgi:hypothetical protein
MKSNVLAVARRKFFVISYAGTGAVSSAISGGNATPAYPSGLQAGDLLWIVAGCTGNNQFATNAISGFTRRVTVQSTTVSPTLAGFYKIATGLESGVITVDNPSGSAALISKMFAYRNVNQTTPFDATDAIFATGSAVINYDIPSQTPTMPGTAALLLAEGNTGAGSWSPPSGYIEVYDGDNGQADVIFCGHRLGLVEGSGLTSGDTGTRTVVKSASIRGVAAGVLLRPAAA